MKVKKIKFVIVGASKTDNTKDLVCEIKSRGYKVYLIQPKKLIFEFSKNKYTAWQENLKLDNMDIFIFRGYNVNIVEAKILAEKLIREKKVVIDEALAKELIPSKIYELSQFIRYGISHPKTFQALDLSSYKYIFDKINFPVIIKPLYGQKGQGIVKMDTKRQVYNFLKNNYKGYLIQEYLEIDSDIRIFIVNNKVIGAIRRFIIPGDFRSNVSLGAKVEQVHPNREMTDLAIRAVKAMKYEVAGVDIITHKGKLYVLEVNSTPQWQKFKKVTGINPAKYIIGYSLLKYKKINK
ncbi:RimK family alpha-L-glutamate ligase [Patescibacteria group bacterium]|nr:RimK family alpha-L-glutamate ligase [Patescibacteria group bacterium]